MSIASFLRLMGLATFLAWIGWFFVLFRIDPAEAGWMSILLFHVALGLALVGSLTTAGVLIRARKAVHQTLLSREVKMAFRHAVLASGAGTASLFLASQNVLTWWNFLGMAVVVGLTEYVFLTLQDGTRS